MDITKGVTNPDKDELGWTPIMHSVRRSSAQSYTKEQLLSFSDHGVSLLSISVASGDITTVRNILDNIDSYDSISKSFVTPFLVAAYNGFNDIINFLCQKWPQEVNSPCIITGMTPLILAVLGKHSSTVELLLKLGADCRTQNITGQNALDLARITGQHDMSRLLISHCGDVTSEGVTNVLSPRPFIYCSPLHCCKSKLFVFSSPNTTVQSLLNTASNPYCSSRNSPFTGNNYFGTVNQLTCFVTPSRNHRKKGRFKKIWNNLTKRKHERTKLKDVFLMDDLKKLLKKLKLQAYWSYFVEQEIDAETFLSLTDTDLKLIGIERCSDRSFILRQIHEYLNKM